MKRENAAKRMSEAKGREKATMVRLGWEESQDAPAIPEQPFHLVFLAVSITLIAVGKVSAPHWERNPPLTFR